MNINNSMREATEKRNSFYEAICDINEVDDRYYVFRDNEYFDDHTILFLAFNLWDWIWNGHKTIGTIQYTDGKAHIVVKDLDSMRLCSVFGEIFEENKLSVIINDDTVKAKETC